jgi:hypothetical protein
VIDGALLLHLVRDELVLLVEEQHAELFAVLPALGRAQVLENLLPRGKRWALQDGGAHEAQGGRANEPQLGDDRVADPVDLLQALVGRVDHLGERAETGDQLFRELLGIAPRQRAEQHELQQLIVGHRVRATLQEALAQTLAVTGVVGRRRFEK